MNSTPQTLAQWMTAGRASAPDVLRVSLSIAEQLSQLHDQGSTHGALSPSSIAISGNAVQILPATDPASGVTPYTPPEIVKGSQPDVRSDIFSFGAIVYEMLTGRHAFEAEGPEALADALISGTPRPSGSPAVDRLMSGCLAKSPDSRFQRVQKVMLELKMLMSAARRAGRASAPTQPPIVASQAPVEVAEPPAPVQPVATPALAAVSALPAPVAPANEHDLESRIASRIATRLREQDMSVPSVSQVANEVLKALQSHSGPAPFGRLQGDLMSPDAREDGPMARLERKALDVVHEKLARMDLVLGSAVERLKKLEENLDALDVDAAAVRDSVTKDIRAFERALKAQSSAIDSTRTAMAQTDDLVERVVEALDTLQTMFMTSPEERSLAS